MDLKELGLIVGAVGTVFGGGGVWSFLSARAQARAAERKAEAEADAPDRAAGAAADLAEAVSAQTRAFVEELQADRRELRKVIVRQSRSIRRLVGRVESLEAENAVCRAEGRQLAQHVSSLEAALRANGIPIPAEELPGSFIVLEGERATVLKPAKPAG